MPTPAVPPTAAEHWLRRQRLGQRGLRHARKRLRLFQHHHVHFPATLLAPKAIAASPSDGQHPLGLDRNLDPSTSRARLPGTFTGLPSRATVQPKFGWALTSACRDGRHTAASTAQKSLGSHQNFSGFIRTRLWIRKQSTSTNLGHSGSTLRSCSCCVITRLSRCPPRRLRPSSCWFATAKPSSSRTI